MKIKIPEYRAESNINTKLLTEQKQEKQNRIRAIIDGAKAESRAFSEKEENEFSTLEQEVKAINATLAAEKRAMAMFDFDGGNSTQPDKNGRSAEERAIAEEKAFCDMIRSVVSEERADANFAKGTNGTVIPSHIANKIIEKVRDICPIYQWATKYNIKGDISVPYYDESSQKIEMDYADEFTELESTSGKFASIKLSGFLAGVLTKISKSLLNNSDFDLLNYVIGKVASAAVQWIEKEFINGTKDKIEGLSGIKDNMIVTAAASSAITIDDLIDTQEAVPDTYQGGAVWIMNRATRKAIRKLKDADGNLILNRDVTAKWGYTLLGKDVYTTDSISEIGAGNKVLFYGDFSGLAVKVSEQVEIEVIREKYATQHCVGVVAWLEMDAKIENGQKISCLKMSGTAADTP